LPRLPSRRASDLTTTTPALATSGPRVGRWFARATCHAHDATATVTATPTTVTWLTWVCTTRLPSPTSHGTMATSPREASPATTRNARNGSTRAFGCHAS